jgi:hypothetical protein
MEGNHYLVLNSDITDNHDFEGATRNIFVGSVDMAEISLH